MPAPLPCFSSPHPVAEVLNDETTRLKSKDHVTLLVFYLAGVNGNEMSLRWYL